jgi:hypothetical protein
VDRLSNKDLRVNPDVADRLKKRFDADRAFLESRSQLSNSDSPSKKSLRTKLRTTFRSTLQLKSAASVFKKKSQGTDQAADHAD